jgi:hypothetical protein
LILNFGRNNSFLAEFVAYRGISLSKRVLIMVDKPYITGLSVPKKITFFDHQGRLPCRP